MYISVLVVDDNPQTLRTAQADFTEMGFSAIPADNGLEAVEYLRTDPSACQIVFMNLRMPVMDGFTATRLIRSELRLDLLPIIGVGQHNSGEERDLALAAGMNDWMPKSRCKEEILTLLLRHLPGFWNDQVLQYYARGNAGHLRELATLFNRMFPQDLASLHSALRERDFPEVAARAHNLRSTAAYAGFEASLGKVLLQMENQARFMTPDFNSLQGLYSDLAQKSRFAMAILQREFIAEQQHNLPVSHR